MLILLLRDILVQFLSHSHSLFPVQLSLYFKTVSSHFYYFSGAVLAHIQKYIYNVNSNGKVAFIKIKYLALIHFWFRIDCSSQND